MDISMDNHGKSVDMDMDGKFHIHGKPANMPLLISDQQQFRPLSRTLCRNTAVTDR